MKKFLPILAACALVSAGASAQVKMMGQPASRVQGQQPVGEKMMFVGNPSTADASMQLYKGKHNTAKFVTRADAAPDTTLLYDYPAGALYYCLTDDQLYSYQSIRMITNAFADVTFNNYSSVTTGEDRQHLNDVTWDWGTYNDGTPRTMQNLELDEYNSATVQNFGFTPFPVLRAGSKSFDIQAEITDNNGNVTGYAPSYWEAGSDGIAEFQFSDGAGGIEAYSGFLSNTLPQLGFYGGFGSASNGDRYGFVANQTFYDLSDYMTTRQFHNTGKKTIGFAEYFEKPCGYVYAEEITAVFSIANIVRASKPLNNQTLTASIYTFNENGLEEEPYATATASDDDCVAVPNSNGLYTLHFMFRDYDPILGETEMPVPLPDEDFIVFITGFENVAATVTALFAGADGWNGYAYALLDDGSIGTIGYTNEPNTPQVSLFIGFHAAVPVAEAAEKTDVYVDAEGGWVVGGHNNDGSDYNDLLVYTLTDPGSETGGWEVSYDEDVVDGLDSDATYLDYGYVSFYVHVQALPEGMESRQSEITFSLLGNEVTYTIHQGEVEEDAIRTVRADAVQKAVYSLSGQQVNNSFKGIVVKDGKKLIVK